MDLVSLIILVYIKAMHVDSCDCFDAKFDAMTTQVLHKGLLEIELNPSISKF